MLSLKLKAQDTIHLKTVEINAQRKNVSKSLMKETRFDTLMIKQNFQNAITTLLSEQSHLFIKNYGPGSLATSSFRGGNASQTAVLWNGININSAMNGTTDLSIIPVSLFDNITVQHGASSALWGSSAVAGSIQLDNNNIFNKGISLKFASSIASFNTHSEFLSFHNSTLKNSFYVKLYNIYSLNNYSYFNIDSASIQKQKNASFNQQHVLIGNNFQLSKNLIHSFNIWYHRGNREIPPVLGQINYGSKQDDENVRIVIIDKYYTRLYKTIKRPTLCTNYFYSKQL